MHIYVCSHDYVYNSVHKTNVYYLERKLDFTAGKPFFKLDVATPYYKARHCFKSGLPGLNIDWGWIIHARTHAHTHNIGLRTY